MSVLQYCRAEMHSAAPWRVTLNMCCADYYGWKKRYIQTDRRMDAGLLHYALRYRRGPRNNATTE